jgi:hypothetical protein
VPSIWHSAKSAYIALNNSFLLLSLSLSLTAPPPPRTRPATPLPPRLPPRPCASPGAAPSLARRRALPAHNLSRRRTLPALARQPRYRALPRPPAAHSPARPPCPRPPAKVHARKVHAADLKPPRPVISPATRRLARDPPSRSQPNLQGDCLLSFCDIVIKKLYVLRV